MVPTPMVYIRIPKDCAICVAVIGSISPRLLTPSVSRIITLLLAVLSFSRLTPWAIAMPMAVPSSTTPGFTSRRRFRSTR